jgi:TolB protein
MQLRVLPMAGGAPKTIAYFFGGKGSLSNNCWSGDGKNIIFLSR